MRTQNMHYALSITTTLGALVAAGALASACSGGGNSPPPPPACDQACTDDVAMKALRDAMKLAFNETLQGKPVGTHDERAPCPLGGSVRVTGTATSNAQQGATDVDLTYAFTACAYAQTDTDAKQTYSVTVDGAITEAGTIAVQPSATTSLRFAGDALSIRGTVYDPPIAYDAASCRLVLGQNGSDLAGSTCGRTVGLVL